MKPKAVFLWFASGTRPCSARRSFVSSQQTTVATNARKPWAFTLIELLVVIAVIGILAALLLPALGRSKENSRAMTCVNNMNQLGVATMVYTVDTGRFPSILEWLYPFKFPTNRVTPSDLTQGQLYPLVKWREVYRCPSETGLVPLYGAIDHSYQISCMMCHAHDVTRCLAPSRSVY